MKRGRKSQAEIAARLTVVEGDFGRGRPSPPPDMQAERLGEIWTEIVSSEPLEHFSTAATRAILKDYCYHRYFAELVSDTMLQMPREWLKGAKVLSGFRNTPRPSISTPIAPRRWRPSCG
jgi:hypothetical protein